MKLRRIILPRRGGYVGGVHEVEIPRAAKWLGAEIGGSGLHVWCAAPDLEATAPAVVTVRCLTADDGHPAPEGEAVATVLLEPETGGGLHAVWVSVDASAEKRSKAAA